MTEVGLAVEDMKAKKLIEVAMPIKEISAESVRDKSIRNGHISTLHLWWARRPLPTCRAVVFASLVPDPLDENCPQAFKDAVFELLQKDSMDKHTYAPYPDIPYTAIHDPMEENLRNRLLMFIGKFSPKCQEDMLAGRSTAPKDQIMDGCLIKWESKNDERVLGKARKLIWVAYNSEKYPEKTYEQLSSAFDIAYKAIHEFEEKLYSIPNRHLMTAEVASLEEALQKAIDSFRNNMPSVFDPFAGGGAIPLEAARLGCRSFGNDINPVAHIIEKGSVEFSQIYGKPITYTKEEFNTLYGERGWDLVEKKHLLKINPDLIEIPNRLSFDVEYYCNKVFASVEQIASPLYPQIDGKTPLMFYWVRTAKCSNPSCGAMVPLMRQYYLSKRRNTKAKDWRYLAPKIDGKSIQFTVESGNSPDKPWLNRANLTCPCCHSITEASRLKEEFVSANSSERIVAILVEDKHGKREYVVPTDEYLAEIANDYSRIIRPSGNMPTDYTQALSCCTWGINQWSDLFTNRQVYVLNAFTTAINSVKDSLSKDEYSKAIITYLSIVMDRIIARYTSFGIWHVLQETAEHPFGRQAIPMKFDFPEINPFSSISSSVYNQLESVIHYIEEENSFPAKCINSSSGETEQFKGKSITCTVTDPPYYDAIAYADISDFFYVWLRNTLRDVYPIEFSTPLTPKAEECTALKHRYNGDEAKARNHFEDKLLQIFKSIELQTSDIVSIMFAHQSTEAWTTLCNSILGANMNISGSWAIDTEVSVALKTDKDFLESSVTVACVPSKKTDFGTFSKIKNNVKEKVSSEVKSLYGLGFRGADLLTACFGKAVSEFGNYETVEKADGSEVTVEELLELARTAAFTALLRDFTGDDYTKFYIGWLQLNGMGDTDFDDATKFTRVGMSVNIGDIQHASILIRDDASRKQHLASFNERVGIGLRGMSEDRPLIDKVHLAMKLWESGDRNYLLPFIAQYGNDINNEFWRVLVVLKELLPITTDDYTQASGLLQNAESLIRDSKDIHVTTDDGPTLFDGLE